MGPTVHVALLSPYGARSDRSLERTRLETLLLSVTGSSSTGRLCPHCGSSAHGQPWVSGGEQPTYVSLSYTTGLSVAAWSTAAPVGVDVERDDGRDAGVYGDLSTWTRAEAIVKATGEGLRRDPDDLPDLWTVPLPNLPQGYVGHVALGGAASGPGGDARVVTRLRTIPTGASGWVALVPLLEPDPSSVR